MKEDIPDEVVVQSEMDDSIDANVININKEFFGTGEDVANSEVLHSSQSETDSSSKFSFQETKLSGAAFDSDGTVYITKAKGSISILYVGRLQ